MFVSLVEHFTGKEQKKAGGLANQNSQFVAWRDVSNFHSWKILFLDLIIFLTIVEITLQRKFSSQYSNLQCSICFYIYGRKGWSWNKQKKWSLLFSYQRSELYHLLGSLAPIDGTKPKFAQLYVHDTENEVANILHVLQTEDDHNSLQWCLIMSSRYNVADDKNNTNDSCQVRKKQSNHTRQIIASGDPNGDWGGHIAGKVIGKNEIADGCAHAHGQEPHGEEVVETSHKQ